MLQCGVEFSQRPPAVILLEQMGEAVAEADDGVELAMHAAVEPTPVGMNGLEDDPLCTAILEGLGQHLPRAVGREYVEAGLEELISAVEARAGSDIEHALLAP